MSDETHDAIERFHDALNNHDIAALTDHQRRQDPVAARLARRGRPATYSAAPDPLVHKNCLFETTDPPDGTRHVVRAAVLQACREFFEQSPKAQFEMEELVTVDDRAFVRWR